jgi:hypothetical protein
MRDQGNGKRGPQEVGNDQMSYGMNHQVGIKLKCRVARIVAGLGCVALFGGSMLHLVAAYPLVVKAITASNLETRLQAGLRSAFFMLGCVWVMLVVITMVGTLAGGRTGKTVVLVVGLGLLAQIPVWIGMMGWFLGNEILLVASVLMVVGGLLLEGTTQGQPAAAEVAGI